MKFKLPNLPYESDALAPIISQTTIEHHYGKHERTYIDNLNHMIEETVYAEMSLEDIVCNSEGALFNNAAQAWNHIFYFFQFSKSCSRVPKGKLAEQILSQFDTFDDFKSRIEEAGIKLFGSGWVWLSADENGTLFITQSSNAGNPLKDGLKPILTIDVWEHAYYLDYQNRRGEYLSRIWDIIDWDVIESRYE